MRIPLRVWVNVRRPTAADFDQIYRTTRRPQDLPWYHPEPPAMLERVVRSRARPGRALDIGCGDGMSSIYLARAGYQVTSIDFAEGAVEMTRAAARRAGVDIEAVCADVLAWTWSGQADLILDSCCLHVRAFKDSDRARYRQQIMRWLADDGDYILVHFDRMFPFDWRPIGPRRRSRREIRALFAPELVEQATEAYERPAPLPVGPTVRERAYWFRRGRG